MSVTSSKTIGVKKEWCSVSLVSVSGDTGLSHGDMKLANSGFFSPQLEYERQVASLKAANAAENDFSVSQAEVSSRQAMLENASDIKVKSEKASLIQFAQGRARSLIFPSVAMVPRK